MQKPIYEEKLNQGLTIQIFTDDMSESPQEWDDEEIFLSAYHRQFTTGEKKIPNELAQCIHRNSKYEDGSICQKAKDYRKKYHIFALEAYIHSGVVLALSQEGDFVDRRWDVSQSGLVFVKKTAAKTKAKAKKLAVSLINEWNDYLSGNVHGYQILAPKARECEADIILDSCWGFYGDYDTNCLIEAKAAAKYWIEKAIADKSEADKLAPSLLN